MRAAKIRIILFSLALSCLVSFSYTPTFAATGDSDSYFNLEANTASSHNYGITLNNSAVHFTSAFTFEMWLKPTNACASNYCHFLVKEDEYAFAVVNGTYQLALNGTSGGWVWQDTTIKPQIGSWQHFAVTHAAGVDSISMYLNSLLVYTGPAEHLKTLNFNTATTSFQIGARVGSYNSLSQPGSQSFIGSIDEVKLWQTVRTQSQIYSDMDSYGPTDNSDLKIYYDFNDVGGSGIINKASGGGGNLSLFNAPVFTSLESTTVTSGVKVVKFPRSYISANGWKAPSGISTVNVLSVGGGGGGGNNVGNGGGGGGGYLLSNLSIANNTSFGIKVGTGGQGGRQIAAGTLTYDGTTYMDGQRGDSSVVTVNAQTYVGGGGGGGDTFWSNNFCGGSGQLSLGGYAGTGSGTGGTSQTGGAGGAVSGTQSTANGLTGFVSTITGVSIYYGSGGGAGSWVAGGYVSGIGANSQGGNGTGADGLNLTGSGGGGNATPCLVGGKGGSGIVIITFSAFIALPNPITSAVYRTTSSIQAMSSEAGKVTFYAFGKVIPGCKSIPTVSGGSFSATCNWKPSQRNYVPITAKFVPNSYPAGYVNLDYGKVFVTARTGNR